MTTELTPRRRGAVVRSADEDHRSSTPLELLFDLCFVVAVAQVAAELHNGIADGRVGDALIGYVTVFIAVWWAWLNFTWFASGHDSNDAPYRLLTLVQMAGVLVLAAGVNDAVVDRNFAVLVVGYVEAGLVTSPTVAISVTAVAMAALVTWKVARFGGPPTPDGAAVNGHG